MPLSKIETNSLDVGQIGGRRNLIINGAMQVAQRGTSSTGVTGGGFYTIDRFRWGSNGEETVSLSQATDAPDGFATSFKVEVTTADSTLEVNDRAAVETRLEGQDLQQLKFGSASAESFTVSFYVKSSVTGDYNLHIGSEGFSRDITSTYTINSANTWEYKTITFVGDTATAIANDNTEGLRLEFHLHVGSTYTSTDSTSWGNYATGRRGYGHTASFIGTLNATWQITGVQLEVGTVATPHEHISYGEQLALCQRYYYRQTDAASKASNTAPVVNVANWNTTQAFGTIDFPVTMRTVPSLEQSSGAQYRLLSDGDSTHTGNTFGTQRPGDNNYVVSFNTSGLTAGYAGWIEANNENCFLAFNAEL